MNCSNISESRGIATEVIKTQSNIINKLIVALFMCLVVIMSLLSIIAYDRYLDSQFEIETTTTTEVIQDGDGYNNYIDGIGDIYNGSESKEDYNNEIQGQ